MRISLTILATALAFSAANANVYHSSDLGWKPGADIAKSFAGLLTSKKLKAGDELVLDHKYQIWGGLELPDRFTISARKGAGFDVIDGGKPKSGRALFKLGDQNTLRNLTLTYLHAPPLGPTGETMHVNYYPKKGEHMRMLLMKDAHSIRYKDIRFLGDRIRPYHIGSIGGSKDLSREAAQALKRTVTGNILPDQAPPVLAGASQPSFAYGPK